MTKGESTGRMAAVSPAVEAPSSEASMLPPVNVLIVDDQPQNLLALEAILEPTGLRLVRAGSGAEALKRLLTEDFAVILLDVQMPGMDGFETAALIKEREKSRHIPIIFLTAISKDEKYVFRGYTVGAVDYLFKPFEPDILRSKVAVFVDLFRKNERIKRQAELLRLAGEREVAEVKQRSERRYRDLAESLPQIVWEADPQGELTYCNRRWFECAGDDRGPPARWTSVLHPDDTERFLSEWKDIVLARTAWEAEFRFGARHGVDFRWHLVRVLPHCDPGGRLVSWVGTATDIDDRKRDAEAQRFLAEASTTLAATLDYHTSLAGLARLAVPLLADACFADVTDDEGELRRVAAAGDSVPVDAGAKVALRDEGYGPAAAVASGQRQFVLDISALAERDPRAAAGLAHLTHRAPRSYLCAPLVARGRVLGAITFVTTGERHYREADVALAEDVARRAALAVDNAQLYAIAERERAQLEQAHRAKDEFLATLSHELRTPLNAMLGWTQLLRAEDLDPETARRGLETIERNTKAQAQLIEDLLDVSRIITGKLHLSARRVRLASVIEAALEVVRPAADAKSIRLEASIGRRVSPIDGDPDRLQQVIWNLVSNAIKFTPPRGHVRVDLWEEHGRVLVRVSDTGQGIAADFLPHVFERFRQADSTSARNHGGLGLGLAIVRHLVELHAGEVTVGSEGEGKGAFFTVSLPPSPRPDTAGEAADETARDSAILSGRELEGVRVLLVEDENDGRDLLREVLARSGAEVTAVSSVAEAWEAFDAAAPTVLVSDIGLPGEDGYSLIRRVRALGGERGALPAAALTAFASSGDEARAIEAGFQAHIAKPVEPTHLVSVVASLAREARRGAAEGRGGG